MAASKAPRKVPLKLDRMPPKVAVQGSLTGPNDGVSVSTKKTKDYLVGGDGPCLTEPFNSYISADYEHDLRAGTPYSVKISTNPLHHCTGAIRNRTYHD